MVLHDNGTQRFIPHFNTGRQYPSNFVVLIFLTFSRFLSNLSRSGSVCKVYGTVPPSGNSSTVLMDVTIDGSVSPIVSQTSNSTAIYADLFYQSSAMESTWHTVIITNKGSAGNLDFEFDRVELDANDVLPTISAFASIPSSTSPQTSPSNTSLPKTSQSSEW